MKLFRVIFIAILSAFIFALFTVPSLAEFGDADGFNVLEILQVDGQENTSQQLVEDAKERGVSPIVELLLRVINILSLLIGTFAFVTLVIGSIIFITSGGNDTAVDRGKAILNNSIFGIIIAFLAYFIVVFVRGLLFS